MPVDVEPSDAAAVSRAPLSRARVAAAALDRIDKEGLNALSMRKLGADLGVEAMSLYNHVRNKHDLLLAVGELLHEQILSYYQPAPDASWQDKARAMAFAWWQVGTEHPNAFPIIADHPCEGPAGMRVLASCVSLFTDAGFTLEAATEAFQSAAAWLVGAVVQENGLIDALRAGHGFTPADVPPELGMLVEFKEICLDIPSELRFRRGLELMIAGIEARLAPGASGASGT
ncbi:MAG TPA: TetR/AcrR family transcriptional regulator C-terminal domain-containing protein [Acidimicrobiales bacterium]